MGVRVKKSRELITQRVGFHYFPDTAHYTKKDLATWLPILKQLKASWLVLISEANRAIPEHFIAGLMAAGITPLIQFPLSLPNCPSAAEMKALLSAYSRWGIKYVILFDRPNDLASWTAAGWVQQDLIERFVDRFLPLATLAVQTGLTPVFPPLQPGGSYWDLTFLKQSLQSIKRRGNLDLIKKMGLSAFAYTFNHELEYGTGGPEVWKGAVPYAQNPGIEDQRGFRNYEWLQSIVRTFISKDLPVFLLGAGNKEQGVPYSPETHAGVCLNIFERLKGLTPANAIPAYVKSCNFSFLSVAEDSPDSACAWFKSQDDHLPIVDFLLARPEEEVAAAATVIQPETISGNVTDMHEPIISKPENTHPIEHYLLLPVYEWGIADFHLEVTRPFIQKYQPTIGFSAADAALARKVTVIGGEQTFSDAVLNGLRASGSNVVRISGDGTSIATQLAER